MQDERNSGYNIEEIRKRFAADRFATEAAGIAIDEVSEGYAKCSMSLEPVHRNAAGAVMGGAVFTLADFCFAVAANSGPAEQGLAVSLSSAITFLSGAKGDKLIGEATCVKSGRSTCLYTVSIADELGTKVGFVTVNGYRVYRT